MVSFPVQSTLLIDMHDLALQIEMKFSACLIPHAAGIYMLGREKPVMVPGQQYFRRETDKASGQRISVIVNGMHDIKGDIFNLDAELILSRHVKPQHLSDAPSVPVVGMKIIEAFAKKLVMEKSAWSRGAPQPMEEMLKEFLRSEMFAHNNQELLESLCEALETMMLDLKTDIRQFLGADDWLMHFVKTKGMDLFVEKTIDFRIYDWTRRTESGDWL